MIKTMRWLLGAVVGFLALVGIIASATHYLQEPYNPGFLEYPVIVALHVVLGGVYLALAPFQFVKPQWRKPGYASPASVAFQKRAERRLLTSRYRAEDDAN